MSTLRKAILDAAFAALSAGSPPVAPERWRGFELPPTTALSMILRPGHEVISGISPRTPIANRTLVLHVECRAAVAAGASLDDALDPLLEWVTAKLGGTTLGGLVRDALEAEIRWEAVQGETRYAKATVFLTAPYHTLVNDATRAT